ncbi:hypothetical protein X801_06760, partial [Opisthorchis viverrini]
KREEETFEDYTAVTDWERFVQSLENLLARWELRADGDPAVSTTFNSRFCLVFLLPHPDTSVAGCISANGSSNWSTSATRLAMAVFYKSVDVGFLRFCIDSIQLGSSVPHILDASDNIFDGHLAAPIACFGLTQALVLRPTEGEISGATRLHLLLSSVEMAVHAVRCPLPVLVAYSDPAYCYGVAAIPPLPSSSDVVQDEVKHEYQVSVLTGALNIDFSVGRMEDSVNPSCTHLDGLRELFLGKLGYPWRLSCPTPEVAIAARFTYLLPYWPEFAVNSIWLQCGLRYRNMQSLSVLLIRSRLKCFSQACLHVPEPQARRPHTRTFSTITSRISWLGADLPRLRNLLRGHSLPAAHQPKSSPDTPEYKLLGEQIIHHLLFLFPDADANFSSSSTMANELTQQSACADQPELLDWSRYQHRASREVAQLASQLNLPPATSLTHRLAVLLCNLNYLQPNQSSDSQLEIMYNEFLLELKLRLDRRINLPTAKAFEESEQHSIALDPGERDDRAPTAAFTSRHNFSAFSDRERCNLHLILEHFNFYIEKARTSSSPSDSEFQDTLVPPDEASEEARSILQWLHSLDLTRLLRLLMPSVCLEALITFHSLSTYADIPFESHGWLRICLATWPFLLTLIVHTGSSTIVK